ncbi:uncharacterized protein LOC144553234 [Carex rostrata]
MARLMTAIHARIGGSTSDNPESSDTGHHTVVQPEVHDMGNPRRNAIPIQDVILEPEQPRRGEMRQEGRQFEQRVNLPRMDFPIFSGIKPTSWVECCNFYFNMYQIPEEYKSRMATMHFTGPAEDWYRCFQIANPNSPPWPILVEEMLSFFSQKDGNVVDEFKRVHQSGNLEEYITQFLQARARLTCKRRITREDFYVEGFISGLKEELRNTIELFSPSTLNDAIRCARQIELSLDSTIKKVSAMVKPNQYHNRNQYQNSAADKPNQCQIRNQYQTVAIDTRWRDKGQTFIRPNPRLEYPKLMGKPTSNLTLDQKRILGLCFKCDEKWQQGHKCNSKSIHTIETENEMVLNSNQGEPDQIEQVDEPNQDDFADYIQYEEDETTFISICNGQYNTSMTFKGQIGSIPICAFMDNGSTHSFIHPVIVHNLGLPVDKTKPLIVSVANRNKMGTDMLCRNLTFSLQGNEFNADLRVLDVQGHDLLLGMNWLTKLGLTLVDWNKGSMKLKRNGKFIKLEDEDVQVGLKMLTVTEQTSSMMKEVYEEGQILLAHISQVEDKVEKKEHPYLLSVLEEFSDLFAEPTVLRPQRDIDHKIPLKPDSKPINLRPYRFSHYQKLEIDKIIEELLKNSFIQPSCSLFISHSFSQKER